MSVFNVNIGEKAASLPMDRYNAEQFLCDLGLDVLGAQYDLELVDSDFLLVLDSNFRELKPFAECPEMSAHLHRPGAEGE